MARGARVHDERVWWFEEVTPTVDEYLSVASVSISCRLIIFLALCSLMPKLPEEVFCSKEYSSLINHISIITRLMNDLCTYKVKFLGLPFIVIMNSNDQKKYKNALCKSILEIFVIWHFSFQFSIVQIQE